MKPYINEPLLDMTVKIMLPNDFEFKGSAFRQCSDPAKMIDINDDIWIVIDTWGPYNIYVQLLPAKDEYEQ